MLTPELAVFLLSLNICRFELLRLCLVYPNSSDPMVRELLAAAVDTFAPDTLDTVDPLIMASPLLAIGS
jgi:hypothetical protein